MKKLLFAKYNQAFKIAAIYCVIGCLWILFSDRIAKALVAEESVLLIVSIIKGWLYVLVTSALLFILVSRSMKRMNAVNLHMENSNILLRAILESSPEMMIFALDEKYCYSAFNNKHKAVMLQIWGKEINIGANVLDIISSQEDRDKARINFDRALAGESFTRVEEYEIEKLAGLYWKFFYSPIISAAGEIVGLTCFVLDISNEKTAADELLQSRDLMRYITEHNRIAVAICDNNLNYMYVSKPYLDMYRIGSSDIIGKHHYEVFPNLPQSWMEVHKRVLNGEVISREEDRFVHEDGSFDWVRWECRPWFVGDGTIGGLVLYAENITHRKQIEQLLKNEKEFLKTTILSVDEGVITTDNSGRITMLNPLAEILTGYTNQKASGEYIDAVLTVIDEYSREPYRNYVKNILSTGRGVAYIFNTMMITRESVEVPIELNASPIKDNGGSIIGAVIIIRDISDKRVKQKEIEYISYHDFLTGLYNRRYFDESLKRLDAEQNLPLSVVVTDVNGLKLTNDAFGHDAGDKILRSVANIITSITGPFDVAFRMGGDEFCIILPRADEYKAKLFRDRLIEEASKLKLDPLILSVAIGIATKNTVEQDIKAIVTAADNEMYRIKIKYGKIMRNQTIDMVLNNINANYDNERIHTERVSHYCQMIAKAMRFDEKEVINIKLSGVFHDIGKIMVPPQLLNKTERLSLEEFEIIKRHPEIGYQIIKSIDDYVHLSEAILHHHERWDGEGYPGGLRGTDIPVCSRIIAVADAYEAMTSSRPYQKTKTQEEAIRELIRCSGSQFDASIVKVFIEKILLKQL
jgi:diguanylate cyclase (GGDEF)-like protein/PAS domain S-box-containing protein